MLKTGGKSEIALLILLIGGHSVASTLMENQIETAVYRSLGVAICVLIFVLIQVLIGYLEKGNGES